MHLVGFEAINRIDQPFDAATQAIECKHFSKPVFPAMT